MSEPCDAPIQWHDTHTMLSFLVTLTWRKCNFLWKFGI